MYKLYLYWPILALLGLTGCAHLPIGDTIAKLDLSLSAIDCEQENMGNRKEIILYAEIRNTGNTSVVLPTKAIGPMVFQTGGAFASIQFQPLQLKSASDGFRQAYSVAEIAPVELRPNEYIFVTYTFKKPGPAGVRVSYEVDKDFATRYNLWHGELTTESKNLSELVQASKDFEQAFYNRNKTAENNYSIHVGMDPTEARAILGKHDAPRMMFPSNYPPGFTTNKRTTFHTLENKTIVGIEDRRGLLDIIHQFDPKTNTWTTVDKITL